MKKSLYFREFTLLLNAKCISCLILYKNDWPLSIPEKRFLADQYDHHKNKFSQWKLKEQKFMVIK